MALNQQKKRYNRYAVFQYIWNNSFCCKAVKVFACILCVRKTDDPTENYEKINLYPGGMRGLVTAHNISSISVKTKLVYERNYIMGLCPIILYLLQFVTGIYGTYPFNFIFCISRVSLSFQLGRHSGADLFQPFLPLAHLAARPIGSGYSSKF